MQTSETIDSDASRPSTSQPSRSTTLSSGFVERDQLTVNGEGTGQLIPPPPASAHTHAEKVLPLPGWLTKVYFIFPVVLYIPDALFNYYVYSDGAANRSTNLVSQTGFIILWGFLSVGVVGMAYLLSVLAPWHWGQGHRIQAIFCGFGVVVATGITTWNSLAYRSQSFVQFQTDQWAYTLWPQLQTNHISVTMILVSIAPPFWGLFWAIVQPTQTGRSLRQLQESHEERLMRLQQEAELKRLRAQTNATIREAQVRGMAQTAAAVREQASGVLASRRTSPTLSGPAPYGATVRPSVAPSLASESLDDAASETASPSASAAASNRVLLVSDGGPGGEIGYDRGEHQGILSATGGLPWSSGQAASERNPSGREQQALQQHSGIAGQPSFPSTSGPSLLRADIPSNGLDHDAGGPGLAPHSASRFDATNGLGGAARSSRSARPTQSAPDGAPKRPAIKNPLA